MKVDGIISAENWLRLECLRLAVQAGQADLRDEFCVFVQNGPSCNAAALSERVAAILANRADDRGFTLGDQP